VRELVLEGRVGTCSDQATQSSWPVLLAPQPRAVSPAETTRVYPLPGTTWFRHSITASEKFVAAGRASMRKPWQQPVARARSTDRGGTRVPELEPELKADEALQTTTPTGPERSGTRDAQPDSHFTESGIRQ
jgi:hypothetical protein